MDQDFIDGLLAVTMSAQDRCRNQLAAFVPFQVRLLTGSRALGELVQESVTQIIEAAVAPYTMAEMG